MRFDAIVLAGGRSRRLGGADKTRFGLGGRSLLARACDAVAGAERIVVVGSMAEMLPGVAVVREDPPFAGPAAAIGAGLAWLGAEVAPLVAIVAADVPHAEVAMAPLLEAAAAGFDTDALLAADESGQRQTLLGVYRAACLQAAVEAHRPLRQLAVRTLFDTVRFTAVRVPPGSTRDVDTWDDVEDLGIEPDIKASTEVDDD